MYKEAKTKNHHIKEINNVYVNQFYLFAHF